MYISMLNKTISMNKMKMMGCLGILAMAAALTACSSSDNTTDGGGTTTETYKWSTDGGLKACDHVLFTNGKEDANGTEIGNGDQEFVFTGNQTLKKGTYYLKGWVYIANGATLTFEPGTIIKGDKATKAALIAERGGKLYAKGSASQPIVFTSAQAAGSRKPGDWGGIILCGKATNNQTEMQIEGGPRTKHGGNDDADCSGALSYVRIEFAGYPFEKDKEINGLTFGSVGYGTQIDHVQVSYSNDDSFEWFGGAVNCKNLVAYRGWDDDLDTDNGFHGKVQFALAVRDPRIADQSQSNGFESDNCADGSAVSPYTTCTFSNITFVGPRHDASFENTTAYINGGSVYPNNGSALGKYQAAMQIRRNSRLNCYNTLAIGYPVGLLLDNQKGDTQGAATQGLLKLQNIWFAGMGVTGTDANKSYVDEYVTGYDSSSQPIYDATRKSFSSTFFPAQAGNKVYTDWSTLVGSNGYTPLTGSPLLTAASFTGLDSWFTQVKYIGAFGTGDNWMTGWTQFDPENAAY
jgi:hypothetical protein